MEKKFLQDHIELIKRKNYQFKLTKKDEYVITEVDISLIDLKCFKPTENNQKVVPQNEGDYYYSEFISLFGSSTLILVFWISENLLILQNEEIAKLKFNKISLTDPKDDVFRLIMSFMTTGFLMVNHHLFCDWAKGESSKIFNLILKNERCKILN